MRRKTVNARAMACLQEGPAAGKGGVLALDLVMPDSASQKTKSPGPPAARFKLTLFLSLGAGRVSERGLFALGRRIRE